MTSQTLKISSDGIELIKKHQGLSLEKYRDEKGVWIIGYGHIIRETELFDRLITPAEAEALLKSDIAACEAVVREVITHPLTQAQYDALVSLLFNFGTSACLQTALLQAVARV